MTDIQAVIFDIGNVMVHWDPRRLFRKYFDDPEEMEYFLANVTSPKWNLEQDRGRSFKDGTALLSKQFPQYEDKIRLFDSHWAETLGPEIPGMVKILNQLIENNISVFAITNFSAEKWPIFCKRHAFTTLFQGIIVSGEVGLVKPDPRIYELAVKRFGVHTDTTLFVDDIEDNVITAQKMGMIGHHFTDAYTLKADLIARGLLASV